LAGRFAEHLPGRDTSAEPDDFPDLPLGIAETDSIRLRNASTVDLDITLGLQPSIRFLHSAEGRAAIRVTGANPADDLVPVQFRLATEFRPVRLEKLFRSDLFASGGFVAINPVVDTEPRRVHSAIGGAEFHVRSALRPKPRRKRSRNGDSFALDISQEGRAILVMP
jgi:hypothetical protein